MKERALTGLFVLLCVGAASICGAAWAVTERLAPTNNRVVAEEDREFNHAMAVWYSHRYVEGGRLLAAFAAAHPDSRWAAEADMHTACVATFERDFAKATDIFTRLVSQHGTDQIAVKAKCALATSPR